MPLLIVIPLPVIAVTIVYVVMDRVRERAYRRKIRRIHDERY